MLPTIAPTAPNSELKASERTARLWDGTEVFYRAWEPGGGVAREGETRKALLLFHRGHEHSGRYQEVVERLGLEAMSVFAWDQRGHGRSPGARGWAPSFGALVKDVESFVRLIGERHGVAAEEMVVLGHSVGAVMVAAWVHDYAPRIRGMVLVTPALRVRLYVPLAVPGLRVLDKLKRSAFIKSYVRSGMLTHDAAAASAYEGDRLISRNIAVNILLGLHDTASRLMADAGAIRTPTLLLAAGSDWVVSLPAQRRFFAALGSSNKQMETYAGFHHAILHEQDRARPIERIRRFVLEVLEKDAARAAGVPSPHAGGPPRPSAAARLGFAVARAALRTGGRLSAGIATGWRTGFDSGPSLDHVYRNTAAGFTPLGRLIDRVYLNSPGWSGIRCRRKNMGMLLERAIRRTHAAKRPVRILDVAAGPGRYVLETIGRVGAIPVRAVLRDRDERGLAAGRALAAELGVADVVYEQGDAFDPASLVGVNPRPTIAIVSGLYELFADNERVLRSLRGLHAVLEDGGTLIYTNQPWHPQLAFIANVLTNRDGEPWVMRCRSQAEMDGLVAAAGFKKAAMETDEAGIFTVSVATKPG